MAHDGSWPDGIPYPPDDPSTRLQGDVAWAPSPGVRQHLTVLSNITVTNAPSGYREITGSIRYRIPVDLTGASEVRLVAGVQGTVATSYKINLELSVDGGGSWSPLVQLAIPSTGLKIGAWTALPVGLGDVVLRITEEGGDGAKDVIFGVLAAQVR